MMRVVIAPDSFKGTLTARAAAACIERGFRSAGPFDCVCIPMADGGEGTVESMVAATGGRWVKRSVKDPLFRPIQARFGLMGDGRLAVLEMAEASGLLRLTPSERNPLLTTTQGTGELMLAALDRGADRLLMGIGGSATTDGGMGMATALGVRFTDRRGHVLPPVGGSLTRIHDIDVSGLDPRLARIRLDVACDVDNPLAGPTGAAAIYGPQKGATPAMVRELDAGLRNLARLIKRRLGKDLLRVPGAGAAGGLGAALVAFCGGHLRPGVELVADAVGLDKAIRNADLVVTGEGRLDGQTLRGKTIAGIAALAARRKVPVIAVCGCTGPGAPAVHAAGVTAYFSALPENTAEAELPGKAGRFLTDCSAQIARVLCMPAAGKARL